MFERFTLASRRAVYFARAAVSQFGGTSIDSSHLLLGVLKADPERISALLQPGLTVARLCHEVETGITPQVSRMSTAMDIPLHSDSRVILESAISETDLLGHSDVDLCHILLATAKLEASPAAEKLRRLGVDYAAVRSRLATTTPNELAPVYVPDADTAVRIAEAAWIALHGEDAIESRRPFEAELQDDIWRVARKSPSPAEADSADVTLRPDTGVLTAFHLELLALISRTDGRILRLQDKQHIPI